MDIHCHLCHKSYRISAQKVAGKRIKTRCQDCGSVITIDAREIATNPPSPASPISPSSEEPRKKPTKLSHPTEFSVRPPARRSTPRRIATTPRKSRTRIHRSVFYWGLATAITFIAGSTIAFTLSGTPTPASPIRSHPTERDSHSTQPYYPLEVGRYWHYSVEDGTQNRRQVVGQATRNDTVVFSFSDGSIAYSDQGNIVEITPQGSMSIIPLGSLERGNAIVYHTQGLRVERTVGAIDTSVVIDHQSFDNCLEIITTYRPIKGYPESTLSYSSYYVRGVGLIGTGKMPRKARSRLGMVLADHGRLEVQN
jgi:predicted Zn finger-like uncharacterized protein